MMFLFSSFKCCYLLVSQMDYVIFHGCLQHQSNIIISYLCFTISIPLYVYRTAYLPRVYPMPFARTMCDLVEQLKASRMGQPQIHGPIPSAMDVMGWEWPSDSQLWQFVDFSQVFTYLRGSKSLAIPVEWRTLVPSQIQWLSRQFFREPNQKITGCNMY